jgi:glycosyltransferase involved in cell wall biosynthesis
MKERQSAGAPPRLGVLDFHPIQYHSPLYQRLAYRRHVNLDVLYLTDLGHREVLDVEFGVPVAWDVDLLSGYPHQFLATGDYSTTKSNQVRTLIRWINSQDVVVIHGYSDPWMLIAMSICRAHRIPYLLRGDSGPPGKTTGIRLRLRNIIVRMVVSRSAGGLAIGQLNEEFYRRFGAPQITFAPYSVDDARFAGLPPVVRSDLLARWQLDDARPVIMFCGKLYPGKRPLDLIAAVQLLSCQVTILFVGDGVLAGQVRDALRPRGGVVTGFVNQSELPAYYHAADILALPSEAEKWGLVINEAMAAGTLPVVSDRVGAVPDLVDGVGEVYRCGDIEDLAAALSRALEQIKDPCTRDLVKRHVARYSLERTAAGFELAAVEAIVSLRCHSSRATASGA